MNEYWLNNKSDLSPIHLATYNMFYQVGNCPGHGHCGLITYVQETFLDPRRLLLILMLLDGNIYALPLYNSRNA